MKTAENLIKKAGYFMPLTARGIAPVLYFLYLLIVPAAHMADIVAAVIGLSLLLLVLITVFYAIWGSRRLMKNLDLEMFVEGSRFKGDTREFQSNKPGRIVLRIGGIKISPFFSLEIDLIIMPRLELAVGCRINSYTNPTVVFPMTVTYPHRGIWVIKEAKFTYGDKAGLCKISWQKEIDIPVKVSPPLLLETKIPPISSCRKPGDLSTDLHKRSGDPFDLKRHHPSDGIKRIIWKVFAKRGELIARHPEAAFAPEGQTVVFVHAAPEDDLVCGEAVCYLQKLEEAGIDVYVGCTGQEEFDIARSALDAKKLFIETAWSSLSGSPVADLQKLLDRATELLPNTDIDQVVVFLPKRLLASKESAKLCAVLGNELEVYGIKPFFILTGEEEIFKVARPRFPDRLKCVFFEVTPQTYKLELSQVKKLSSLCAGRHWQFVFN